MDISGKGNKRSSKPLSSRRQKIRKTKNTEAPPSDQRQKIQKQVDSKSDSSENSDDDKPVPKIPSFGISDSEDDEDPLDQSQKTRKRANLDSSSSESYGDDMPIPKVPLFSDSENVEARKQVDSDSSSTETDSDDTSEDDEEDSDEDEDPIVHWRTTTQPTIRLKFDLGDSDSEADQSTVQNRTGQTTRRVTFNNTVCIMPATSSPGNNPVKPPPPKPSRKSTRIINQPPRLVIKPNQKSYH
ncbi:unnamed protein product [Caenorhabditis nigoni]